MTRVTGWKFGAEAIDRSHPLVEHGVRRLLDRLPVRTDTVVIVVERAEPIDDNEWVKVSAYHDFTENHPLDGIVAGLVSRVARSLVGGS